MDLKDLESRIEVLEKEVKALKDIDQIKTLQRAYGYYLEHWMSEEVIDCFSDSPDVVLALYEGTWLGKKGIKKYFTRENISPEFLHQVMQLSQQYAGQTACLQLRLLQRNRIDAGDTSENRGH